MMTLNFFNKTKVITALCGMAMLLSNVAPAAPMAALEQHKDFGLGIIVGQPSGLVAKLWQGRDEALDFGVAYSFNGFVELYADYLYHFHDAFAKSNVKNLTPYIGIGGVFWASSAVTVGIRVPLGLEWMPLQNPIGFFLEVAPGINIIPSTAGTVQGGIGARYYF